MTEFLKIPPPPHISIPLFDSEDDGSDELDLSSLIPEDSQWIRWKIWEIPQIFHCTLVGICLDASDVRQLISTMNLVLPPDASEYFLHSVIVKLSNERSTRGRLIHDCIDKKFNDSVILFSSASEEQELLKRWEECLQNGNIPGPYWALMTHPSVTPKLRECAFGDIHMLSHYMVSMRGMPAKKLQELESRLAQSEQEKNQLLEKSKKQLAQRDARIAELEELLDKQNAEEGEDLGTVGSFDEAKEEIQQLKTRLSSLEWRIALEVEWTKAATDRASGLSRKLRALQRKNNQLEKEYQAFQKSHPLTDEEESTSDAHEHSTEGSEAAHQE